MPNFGKHAQGDDASYSTHSRFRSALKVAQVDLANARSHVAQFQEISEANEGALASLNTTYDEYKEATEAELARRQVRQDAMPSMNTH